MNHALWADLVARVEQLEKEVRSLRKQVATLKESARSARSQKLNNKQRRGSK